LLKFARTSGHIGLRSRLVVRSFSEDPTANDTPIERPFQRLDVEVEIVPAEVLDRVEVERPRL
jgi:hypothetical protein